MWKVTFFIAILIANITVAFSQEEFSFFKGMDSLSIYTSKVEDHSVVFSTTDTMIYKGKKFYLIKPGGWNIHAAKHIDYWGYSNDTIFILNKSIDPINNDSIIACEPAFILNKKARDTRCSFDLCEFSCLEYVSELEKIRFSKKHGEFIYTYHLSLPSFVSHETFYTFEIQIGKTSGIVSYQYYSKKGSHKYRRKR